MKWMTIPLHCGRYTSDASSAIQFTFIMHAEHLSDYWCSAGDHCIEWRCNFPCVDYGTEFRKRWMKDDDDDHAMPTTIDRRWISCLGDDLFLNLSRLCCCCVVVWCSNVPTNYRVSVSMTIDGVADACVCVCVVVLCFVCAYARWRMIHVKYYLCSVIYNWVCFVETFLINCWAISMKTVDGFVRFWCRAFE